MADENGFAEWGGYMEAKVTKLEEQYSAASTLFRKSDLFAGISIYVNGLTDPSADELKRIMMVHGGTFHHYERSHTTYIIASNLPDVKVRNMDTSKIISAKWVVDCVAANRMLDYTQYLLYTNQKTTQPRLNFDKAKKEPDSNNQTRLDDKTDKNETKTESMTAGKILKANTTSTASNTARTAVDPNFLPEFYNNSRLHHIATLGSSFKQYVSDLREKHDYTKGFPARQRLKQILRADVDKPDFRAAPRNATFVMHIDMDCFFVSVGLRKHQHLHGQPVAVTHSKGGAGASDVPVHPNADREAEMELFAKRFEQHLHNNILSDKVRNGFDAKMSLSEIASCSYEAREKGVRNGMFVGQALKLCPELKTIPYDFEGYKEVAYALYDIIAQYTLQIEAVSCDEMFVDLSDLIREYKLEPMDLVRFLRDEVRLKTGCPCSAGVGANKLQARMATKRAKPDGQYYLNVDDVEAYMANIPAEELPGVGSSTNYVLKEAGCITCGDLQRLSLTKLQGLVGKKLGEKLHQFCRGIDSRPLLFEQIRKCVSAGVNYGIRFNEDTEVETFLRQLCAEVHLRLCEIRRKTKCVTLKVMVRAKEAPVETSKFMGHGVCDNITKSVLLNDFTNDAEIITRSILTTMKNLNLPPHELRGLGVQLTKLDEPKSAREPKENILRNMFNKLNEKKKAEAKEMPAAPEKPIITPATVLTAIGSPSQDVPKEKSDLRFSPQANTDSFTVPEIIHTNTENHMAKAVPGCIELEKPSFTRAINNNKRNSFIFGPQEELTTNVKKRKYYTPEKREELVLPPYIDAEVFASLPMDIRIAVLSELERYKDNPLFATSSANKCKLTDMNSNEHDDEQPSTSRAALERRAMIKRGREEQQRNSLKDTSVNVEIEIEGDMSELNKAGVYERSYNSPFLQPSEMNIFLQPNCNQMILEWVKSDEAPYEYDVNLFCKHAREMIRANRLNGLYPPLAYLSKLVEKIRSHYKDTPWTRAYYNIMNAINEEVNRLHLGKKILTRDIKL